MKEEFDDKLRESLIKASDQSTSLKNDVWKNIQKNHKKLSPSKRSRKPSWTLAILAAILFISLVLGFTTETGQAVINSIKERFVPEKDVNISIEGQEEETHVELESNETFDYVIYIDTSRYETIEGERGDKIVPNEDFGDKYPEVSMEIWQEDLTKEEIIKDIKAEIKEEDYHIEQDEMVDYPLQAYAISSYEAARPQDYEWDTQIHRYYIIETDNPEQNFIIKQKYYLEASEGHATRMDAMLEEFEIVDADEPS